MTTWYYKYVDDHNEAFNISQQIDHASFTLDLALGDLEYFISSRLDGSGRTHFYFSPEAKPIALMFNATSCHQPTKENVGSIIVGIKPFFDLLYP